MTATERFKWLLANALERVCLLEEEIEKAKARIAHLESEKTAANPETSDTWDTNI